jgi:hypothetical protein
MRARRFGMIALMVLLLAPYVLAEERDGEKSLSWGGEIRFRAVAIDGDEGFGRTGEVLETRFFLDAPLAPRLSAFADLGAGSDQGVEGDAGLNRLYIEYEMIESVDFSARAGWVRVPFGRWDPVTISRPLIKDREFFNRYPEAFQIRRSSAGFALRSTPGPVELDLAFVDRMPAQDWKLGGEAGRDLVGRVGIRHRGFRLGLSYLTGLGTDPVMSGGEEIDLGAVSSYGLDVEYSFGLMTVGGEAIVVDIDGRLSTGYYIQGSYNLSALVRGLRVLAKYDVLNDGSTSTEAYFRRATIGTRFSLRRDLDLEVEFNRDFGEVRDGFGGTHVIVGATYRF